MVVGSSTMLMMDNRPPNLPPPSTGSPEHAHEIDAFDAPFKLETPICRSPPVRAEDALNTPSVTSATAESQSFFGPNVESEGSFPSDEEDNLAGDSMLPSLTGKHKHT